MGAMNYSDRLAAILDFLNTATEPHDALRIEDNLEYTSLTTNRLNVSCFGGQL